MSNTERIIDKIKKLIKHQGGNRTQEEAAAFAEKIQQLCIDHKIAAEQVRVDDEPEEKIGEERVAAGAGRTLRYGDGARVPREDSSLMLAVAKAHFCEAILIPRTNTILVVGAEEDRAVVVEMFRFLVSTMKRLGRIEEEKTRRARRSVRKFKPYFYQGFTSAVHRRYRDMRETSECTALVRADALVKRYVESNYETVKVKSRKQPRINKNAYFAGVVAGRNVSLGTNVIGGE